MKDGNSGDKRVRGHLKSAIVAQLSDNTNMQVPYSCISSSPDGRLLIMGGQETARIVSVKPSGLKEVKSTRISQVRVRVGEMFYSATSVKVNLH